MWKWAILGSPDPPKPLQGPPDPTGGPGRPKMAKINIIQSTGDNLGQQIIFGGCQFFFSFFTRNDPMTSFLSPVPLFLALPLLAGGGGLGALFGNRRQ